MSDYDYLNARVRSKHTELLSREFYEQLLGGEDHSLVIDALLNSSYANELRSALTVGQGFGALHSAIGRHVHSVFVFLLETAPDAVARLLALQLAAWELQNVLTIVRGMARGLPRKEIARAVTPIAELSEPALETLAEEPDIATLLNTLATWGYDYSRELRLALRDNEVDLRQAEHQLHRAYFARALAEFPEDQNGRMFQEQLARQIDLYNVKRALDSVRRRVRNEEPALDRPLPGGHLPEQVTVSVSLSDDLESAFETLGNTYFVDAVEKGILAFGERGTLSAMERFLEEVIIAAGCSYFRRDPLSAAVPLGFLWRQYNELLNLRILLHGREYRVPGAAIREELLFV